MAKGDLYCPYCDDNFPVEISPSEDAPALYVDISHFHVGDHVVSLSFFIAFEDEELKKLKQIVENLVQE